MRKVLHQAENAPKSAPKIQQQTDRDSIYQAPRLQKQLRACHDQTATLKQNKNKDTQHYILKN